MRSREVLIKLTLPQAMALREMISSSDQMNDDEDVTRPMVGGIVALERAIEKVRGPFAHRLVPHPKESP